MCETAMILDFCVNVLMLCRISSVVQVIIRYEMSPLVRISSQKKVCNSVLNRIIGMLSSKQEHRLKLLE